MRILFVAALLLPFTAASLMAAPGASTPQKTIKIKEEIVNNCGNFPYAPTIAMDAKTATIDDMRKARAAVDQYTSEVSYYEKCLLSLEKKLGAAMTTRDVDFIVFVFNRAQEERDVLAIDFNKLVDDYNAANGIVTKPAKPAKPAKPPAKVAPKPAKATP